MRDRRRDQGSVLRAILGPTNTGKTHRAIDRMLQHRTGMIGLPLRLLAREVYDRVVARRGTEAVALITGEERRVPEDPQYFVCTVEAMPVERPVAFVAIDEVQLAADRNRGHTFTDRILHARGAVETLFLGAMTVADVLEQLVPDIVIDSAPRLSQLTFAGTRKLGSVPPRSAVVAFSAEAVYETAERLRALHGGAAVVLGALSPRTRNAQVAMYEAGEVKHLVATDAIGMGLNMDVQHVAFAALRKFDGRAHRELTAPELAQIAGRAGRYTTDGTFGTTKEAGDLRPDLAEAIETHAFPPVAQLFWRNSALDYDSVEALSESLRKRPPHQALVAVWNEDDQRALETLGESPEMRRRLTSPEAVARLWAVCQVPDYRKTHTDAHVELLGQVATFLLDEGPIPDAFVDRYIERLDRMDGDIETLMARIAWIRTWTYVAWQRDWTTRPHHYQEATKAIEDRLSDALHERLTARFVDRRVLLVLDPKADDAIAVEGNVVSVGGYAVGELNGWSYLPTGGRATRAVDAAIRRRLRANLVPQVDLLCAAEDDAIEIDPQGGLRFQGEKLGRLVAGPSTLEPKVTLHHLDLLEPADRERVRVRLQRWRDALVETLFEPFRRPAASRLSPPAKGLLYALEKGLGTVDREAVADIVASLSAKERTELAKLDVRIGAYTVYVQSLYRKRPMTIRALLWSVGHGRLPVLCPPPDGRAVLSPAGYGRHALAAMGFRGVGGMAVRADVLERVGAEVRNWQRSSGPQALDPLMSWLGATRDQTLQVVRGLGYQVNVLEDGAVALRRAR